MIYVCLWLLLFICTPQFLCAEHVFLLLLKRVEKSKWILQSVSIIRQCVKWRKIILYYYQMKSHSNVCYHESQKPEFEIWFCYFLAISPKILSIYCVSDTSLRPGGMMNICVHSARELTGQRTSVHHSFL